MQTWAAAALVASFAMSAPSHAAIVCPHPLTVQAASKLQMDWFHSLGRLDRAAYNRITTPDFMVFELGKLNSRDEEYAAFEKLIRSGDYAEWSVTNAHLDADCNVAALHYRDVGMVKIGNHLPVPMQWLEVAIFRRFGSFWKLSMQSSMRDASFAGKAPKPE